MKKLQIFLTVIWIAIISIGIAISKDKHGWILALIIAFYLLIIELNELEQ